MSPSAARCTRRCMRCLAAWIIALALARSMRRYAPRHLVFLSGQLARIVGSTKILVNSLHGQAIDAPARGLVVEALAPDDTIEAVRVERARGFAFGVQWHPEWGYADDSASLAIFRAFGEACVAYRTELRKAA